MSNNKSDIEISRGLICLVGMGSVFFVLASALILTQLIYIVKDEIFVYGACALLFIAGMYAAVFYILLLRWEREKKEVEAQKGE